MTSFILLRTINPNFINPTTIALSPSPGVYFVGPNIVSDCPSGDVIAGGIGSGGCKDANHPDGFIYEPAENYVPDTVLLESNGLVGLYYYCPGSTNGQSLLLWTYDEPLFHIKNANTINIPCGNVSPNSATPIKNPILSFFWMYQSAGAYYYMTEDCTGLASRFSAESAGQTTSGDIPWFEDVSTSDPSLDQRVRSFRILNYPNQTFNYGVILNNDVDFQDECSDPVITNIPTTLLNSATCFPLKLGGFGFPTTTSTLDSTVFNPFSAYIIKQDRNPNSNTRNQGVSFWSSNKHFTVYQYGNSDPSRNIGFMWKYDKNSAPADITFPEWVSGVNFANPNYREWNNGLSPEDPLYEEWNNGIDPNKNPNYVYIPSYSLPNDGNIDNAIRFLGTISNNGYPPESEWQHECLEFREDHPDTNQDYLFDPSYVNPLYRYDIYTDPKLINTVGRGYRSCVNKITWVGDYSIIIYTHNEDIGKRSCKIITEQTLIYDGRISPPYSNIPGILTQNQTIYRTIVIPTAN